MSTGVRYTFIVSCSSQILGLTFNISHLSLTRLDSGCFIYYPGLPLERTPQTSSSMGLLHSSYFTQHCGVSYKSLYAYDTFCLTFEVFESLAITEHSLTFVGLAGMWEVIYTIMVSARYQSLWPWRVFNVSKLTSGSLSFPTNQNRNGQHNLQSTVVVAHAELMFCFLSTLLFPHILL